MTIKKLGRGLGVVMTVLAVVGIPSMSAFADSTCYVGCTTGGGGSSGGGGGTSGGGGPHPVTGPGSGSGSGSGSTGSGSGSTGSGSGGNANAVSTKSSGGGLPFTGADIEEMTAIGAGALVVGGVLVRRGRNRRRAGA